MLLRGVTEAVVRCERRFVGDDMVARLYTGTASTMLTAAEEVGSRRIARTPVSTRRVKWCRIGPSSFRYRYVTVEASPPLLIFDVRQQLKIESAIHTNTRLELSRLLTLTFNNHAAPLKTRHRDRRCHAIGQGRSELSQGDQATRGAHHEARGQRGRRERRVYVETGGKSHLIIVHKLQNLVLTVTQKQALQETKNVLPGMKTKIELALERLEDELVGYESHKWCVMLMSV